MLLHGQPWIVENAVVDLFASHEAFDAETPTYTLTTDATGIAAFYDLPNGTYYLVVTKGDLSNITASGYLIEGVFQTQEEIDNAAIHPGHLVPGNLKYLDCDGDGRITSADQRQYDDIPLIEGEPVVREVVIGKE